MELAKITLDGKQAEQTLDKLAQKTEDLGNISEATAKKIEQGYVKASDAIERGLLGTRAKKAVETMQPKVSETAFYNMSKRTQEGYLSGKVKASTWVAQKQAEAEEARAKEEAEKQAQAAAKETARAERQAAKETARRTREYIKLGATIGKVLGKTTVGTFKDISNIARGIGRRFKDAAKDTFTLDGATKKLMNSMWGLRVMFTRRIKWIAIKAVLNDIGQSMGNLAGENETFNSSMSRTIAGLKTFNNQLAAVFAPIMNVIAPILEAVTQKMSAFGEKIAAFNASITGQLTYEKALPVQYNYAEAMGKTAENTDEAAKSARSAAKAQAEYNATVLSFDQLHKLNGGSSSNSDASGMEAVAESAANAAKMFETMPVSAQNKASKFGNELRRAFAEKDWRGMAQAIGNFAKEGLQRLDNAIKWENTGAKIRSFIDGFTTTANALIADKDLFALAGTTIGHGIDTIARSFEYFDRNMNWGDFGNSIGVAFNNGLAAVNWESVGSDLMAFFMIPWEMFTGFIKEMDATSFGEALKSFFTGALNRFDGTTIGEGIGNLVSKLSQAITIAFGEKEKWEQLGQEIVNLFNGIFNNVKGSDVAEALNAMIGGIITTVGTLLKDDEFRSNAWQFIVDFLGTLDWAGIAIIAAPLIIKNFALTLAPLVASAFVKSLASNIAAGVASSGFLGGLGGFATSLGAGAGAAGTAYGLFNVGKNAYSAITSQNSDAKSAYGRKAGKQALGMGAGAAAGAAIGSVIPVIGTGVGALIGAGVGYFAGNHFTKSETEQIEELRRRGLLYADGGFPATGQAFIARESGAELVGSISGRTAVMNNDQIVAAVSQGVAQAVSNVLANNNSSQDIVLRIDSEDIARASNRGNRRLNIRNNPQIAFG